MNNKVLFVRANPYEENFKSYNVQGVGVARAFCRMGYDCDYLTFTKLPEHIDVVGEENGHTARVLFMKWKRILRTGICKDALSKEFLSQYDFVICREHNQVMTHKFAKTGIPTSMYSGPYWNMFMLPFISPFYDFFVLRKIEKEMKYKFVKSDLTKKYLEKKGMTGLVDVGVGLDTDGYVNQTPTEDTQKLMQYMTENPCILYIGELNDNKNLPFLLETFQKALKKNPELRLVLIGKSSQTLLKKLMGKSNESYAREVFAKLPADIKDKIHHIQRVENPQLQFIYPLAKAFLLPSKKEIFGMVMLEAMHFGAPVITSYNGGSSTLIKDASTGVRIPKFDSDLWAEAVDRYLKDEAYASSVKANAKKLVDEQYVWDVIVKKMIDCMKEQ